MDCASMISTHTVAIAPEPVLREDIVSTVCSYIIRRYLSVRRISFILVSNDVFVCFEEAHCEHYTTSMFI